MNIFIYDAHWPSFFLFILFLQFFSIVKLLYILSIAGLLNCNTTKTSTIGVNVSKIVTAFLCIMHNVHCKPRFSQFKTSGYSALIISAATF